MSGGGIASASAPAVRRGGPGGYALTLGAYALYGLTPTLMAWTGAGEGVLLVLRYAVATATLLLVFARRRPLAGLLRPGVRLRYVLMAAFDSSQVFAYFFAVRELGVGIATFIFSLFPLWVALIAPRALRSPTERSVYAAFGVALVGTGLILAPSLLGGETRLSAAGVAAALASGVLYALLQMTMKRQTSDVSGPGAATVVCLLNTLLLLPFAVWQTAGGAPVLTRADVAAAVIMGVLTTALAFVMWIEGVARIRVQHSAILGLFTTVAAPVFAWVFLGQRMTGWTLAGGALILVAGGTVILTARPAPGPEPPL